MKTKTKIWTSLLTGSLLTLALLFGSVSLTKTKVVNEVSAESSQTITITGAAFSTTDGNQTATFGDYEFKGKVKQYQTTVIWFTSGSGYLYNSTDLGSITKLTLSYNSGGSAIAVQRFNFGSESMTSFKSSGGKTISTSTGGQTYEETGGVGFGFFNISVTGKNLQLKSLVVEFIPKSSAVLQDIEVSGTPTKTTYFVGESFDPTGLTVKAIYDDESEKDVTDKCVFTPAALPAGTPDILISYTEEEITKTHTLSGEVTVIERHLQSLQITTNPTKMNYFVGDSFDPTGMVVKANYDSGDPVVDYKGYDYSPKSAFTSAGSKEITISDLVDETIFVNLTIQVTEQPPIEELFFSEYIEGDGNNKALELYNGTGSNVNLSNYKIKTYTNGKESPQTTISLSGTLAHQETFVITHNNPKTAELKNYAQMTTVDLVHNGDDAIRLYKNDVEIDLIGVVGDQPTSGGWDGDAANGPGSTLDKTLVRTPTTLGPNSTFDWSEWNCYPKDTFTYLGSHTVNVGTPAHVIEAIAYGETFLSETSAGCTAQSLSALEAVWGGLKTQYTALSANAKDYFKSLIPNESGNAAEHTLARYSYIIDKYETLKQDNFLVDSQGAPIFSVNLTDHVSAVNYPKIVTIILIFVVLTLVSGTFLIVRRKHKKIR